MGGSVGYIDVSNRNTIEKCLIRLIVCLKVTLSINYCYNFLLYVKKIVFSKYPYGILYNLCQLELIAPSERDV